MGRRAFYDASNRCIYDSIVVMDASPEAAPDDVAGLKEALAVARAKASKMQP